jgi:hypothetical protein
MTVNQKPPQYLWLAWLAFLSMGVFQALTTPLVEGIDEPAHFAYVQYVAQTGLPPLGRIRNMPEEMVQFMSFHPVSWSLHTIDPSLLSHDEYWKLTPDQRSLLDHATQDLRFSGHYLESPVHGNAAYENHQPPLFYYLVSPVFAIGSRLSSFVHTFLTMRLCCLLLASLLIPGAYVLASNIFQDKRAGEGVLLLVVLFPGLYPGVVRVSNDALAVALACWFFCGLVLFVRIGRDRELYWTSAAAVLGLWTKAFFIPIVAGAILALSWQRKVRSAATLLVISAFGWVWYVFVFLRTGSITGLPETVSADTSIASSFRALWKIDWRNAWSVLRSSHIWIGNGSLLGVRSWMYQLIGWIFLILLAGVLIKRAERTQSGISSLIVCYTAFGAALAYFATQVFQQSGASVIQGWYLTMFIPVEAVLCISGAHAWLGRRWNWAISAIALLFLALLFYSELFVALPYYAGLTSHTASGHLATYHPAFLDFSVMLKRLLGFESGVGAIIVPSALLGIVAGVGVRGILRINHPGSA